MLKKEGTKTHFMEIVWKQNDALTPTRIHCCAAGGKCIYVYTRKMI